MTRLKCAAGLAELATSKYKTAAKHFLQASLDHCDFPELMSPNNVALYGGLCALATFSRQDLQKHVIFSRYSTHSPSACQSIDLIVVITVVHRLCNGRCCCLGIMWCNYFLQAKYCIVVFINSDYCLIWWCCKSS